MTEISIGWSTLLLAGKWCFIGLIYLALLVVLVTVRRELRAHVRSAVGASPQVAAGRLKVIQGGSDAHMQPGQVFDLQPETTLGADLDNTLVLGDHFISSRHARLRWDGVGWWVEDLGSRNGTLVNGRPCPPHVRQPIAMGAKLVMGDMAFELME
jgi:hypothetical protein